MDAGKAPKWIECDIDSRDMLFIVVYGIGDMYDEMSHNCVCINSDDQHRASPPAQLRCAKNAAQGFAKVMSTGTCLVAEQSVARRFCSVATFKFVCPVVFDPVFTHEYGAGQIYRHLTRLQQNKVNARSLARRQAVFHEASKRSFLALASTAPTLSCSHDTGDYIALRPHSPPASAAMAGDCVYAPGHLIAVIDEDTIARAGITVAGNFAMTKPVFEMLWPELDDQYFAYAAYKRA